MKFLTTLHVVRSKPAPNVFGTKIGMQPFRKFMIFGAVADKARIELNRLTNACMQELDLCLWNTRAFQKDFHSTLVRSTVSKIDSRSFRCVNSNRRLS